MILSFEDLVGTINDSFGSLEEAVKKEISKISWLYSPSKSKGSGSEFVTDFIDSMIDGSPVSLMMSKELTAPNALALSYIYTAYSIDRSLVENTLRSVFR